MYLLDLSGGVSAELLFASFTKATPYAAEMLQECFQKLKKHTPYPFMKEILYFLKNNPSLTTIKQLHDKLSTYETVSAKDCFSVIPCCREKAAKFLKRAKLKNLDPWNIFIYISLILLQNNLKDIFFVSIPSLGISSQAKIFEIFKEKRIRIDTKAREISLILALFLETFLTPFWEYCSMHMKAVTKITDPLLPAYSTTLFELYAEKDAEEADSVIVFETNIDDSTPEIIAAALQHILDQGALDFTIIPATMKKGRPGFFVQVLSPIEKQEKIQTLLLTTTSTFGVRKYRTERRILKRELQKFHSSFGEIRVKYGFLDDKCIKAVPEIEDIIALSKTKNIPLIHVFKQVCHELYQQDEITKKRSVRG
jgi:hypothetical protein